ncbi:DUF4342 domain-containing protein [Orenia marismortui]|uniref:Uncharacterized protein DUF4342 n=1 Tax=Orenia marismortui TaxID=46469 RepID=A0A4R8H6U2_9FIRM|nr:DUF4342 domain-containing protein [Orenia marismortui]TDX51054.1 uncharacterized protein DUF4342 [Orenia marismortui]
MEELEKVDVIRERTGVSYEQALEALREVDGDVLEAIVKLEKEEQNKYRKEEFQVRGEQVLNKFKELIKEGNVTRIKVKKDDKVLLDIPVNVGVVGAVLSPPLALLGATTALLSKATIEVERAKKSADNLNNNIDNQDEF